MRPLITFTALVALAFFSAALSAQENPNREGTGERLGERIDREVQELGNKLQQGWAEIRKSVDQLSIQGRVYGRLHWDKALQNATFDVQIQNDNVIVLTGSVADEATRLKAATLAQDTVGVQNVINQLAIAPPISPIAHP
jgi:hyperosmotically inducible periplasmic protein